MASMATHFEDIFSAIGLLERFNESLILFDAVLGTSLANGAMRREQPRAEHKRGGEDMRARRDEHRVLLGQLNANPEWLEPLAGYLALYAEGKRIFEKQLEGLGGLR